MSGLIVNTLKGETVGSSPTFPDGVVISGVVTSTSFSGNVDGSVVTGNISGTTGTFSGDVSIGGTLTYDDVTNVDSVGIVTAQAGIRVGAGQSISAISGIVTYYGDGSQLTGVEAGFKNFVASGNIHNGATVVINTDGTVGIITNTDTYNPSLGTEVAFADYAYVKSGTYDTVNKKVVIAYRDSNNNNYGTAIVGTVSGNSISFGTPVVFNSNGVSYLATIYEPNEQKIVIVYYDNSSSQGGAVIGTVSGNTISFGSLTNLTSNNFEIPTLTYDTDKNKVIIFYRNGSSSNYGNCLVGTVSGNSITFGSELTFNSGTTNTIACTYDSYNNKPVVVYGDGSGSVGKAMPLTVSGTSISPGTAASFNSSSSTYIKCTFDSINNKVIIGYKDGGNSNYGRAIVGTVSGNTLTYGSAVTFQSQNTEYISIQFDPGSGKSIIGYTNASVGNYGQYLTATVSGNNITFTSATTFAAAVTVYNYSVYDSVDGAVIFIYSDYGNSDKGTAIVYSLYDQSTNLTSENYIGIAAEAISDGVTGKVNTIGGVNSSQTGLTPAQTYYVQGDGTLGTSAGNPSVIAGTSISDTEVLVWTS